MEERHCVTQLGQFLSDAGTILLGYFSRKHNLECNLVLIIFWKRQIDKNNTKGYTAKGGKNNDYRENISLRSPGCRRLTSRGGADQGDGLNYLEDGEDGCAEPEAQRASNIVDHSHERHLGDAPRHLEILLSPWQYFFSPELWAGSWNKLYLVKAESNWTRVGAKLMFLGSCTAFLGKESSDC